MEAGRVGINKERKKNDINQVNELESDKQSTMFFKPLDLLEIYGVKLCNFYRVTLGITFFFREFQPMASALNSSLLSNQDTNQFFVQARIKIQIFYTTIGGLTS